MECYCLPNFLIVGSAKCGTTSLYNNLIGHPEIFLSPKKEPRFITSQFLEFPQNGPGDRIKPITFDQYKKFFGKVKLEKAIGEASTDYLYYHSQSVHLIKQYLGNVKIIILLRNPTTRAFSSYMHLIREGRETLCFEEALQEENKRINSNYEFIWHYTSTGYYYNQVKTFLESFDSVFIGVLEEIIDNPEDFYKNIFHFLEVDPSYKPSKMRIKYNTTGIPKFKRTYRLLTSNNPYKKYAKKLLFRQNISLGSSKILSQAKNMLLKKIKLDKKLRIYLNNLYESDIENLSKLINRDLSFWLENV